MSAAVCAAGCSSVGAVTAAKSSFAAAKAAGAKEKAPYEYYAAQAYLELAQRESKIEDHGQARSYAAKSSELSAAAAQKAGGGAAGAPAGTAPGAPAPAPTVPAAPGPGALEGGVK